MYASLDWLPALVGGGLAFLGFCLVWYRLRRLERHYQPLDDDKREPCAGCGDAAPPKDHGDPAECQECGRSVFAGSLAFYKGLDTNDKRDYCPGCGGYYGPEPKDDDDPPPPIPVAPSLLLRLRNPHPEHCDCEVCVLDRRIAMDEAQFQTLRILDDLDFMRQGLKTLRATVLDDIASMERRIETHLGK